MSDKQKPDATSDIELANVAGGSVTNDDLSVVAGGAVSDEDLEGLAGGCDDWAESP